MIDFCILYRLINIYARVYYKQMNEKTSRNLRKICKLEKTETILVPSIERATVYIQNGVHCNFVCM